MDENLQSQYDQITHYISEYFIFAQKIAMRPYKFTITGIKRNPNQFTFKDYRAVLKQTNLLSGKMPETYRDFFLKSVTDEEKQSEYFEILSSEYLIDSLASHLVNRFPQFDFVRLNKMHGITKDKLIRNKNFPLIGIILAIGATLLNNVPASVVEQFVASYADFESVVFLTTVVVVGFFWALWYPVKVKYDKAQGLVGEIGDTLTYITIKQDKSG